MMWFLGYIGIVCSDFDEYLDFSRSNLIVVLATFLFFLLAGIHTLNYTSILRNPPPTTQFKY